MWDASLLMDPTNVFTYIGWIVTGLVVLVGAIAVLWAAFWRGSQEAKAVDQATKTWRELAESRGAVIDEFKDEIDTVKAQLTVCHKEQVECEKRLNDFGKQLLRVSVRNESHERVINELREQFGLPRIEFESSN